MLPSYLFQEAEAPSTHLHFYLINVCPHMTSPGRAKAWFIEACPKVCGQREAGREVKASPIPQPQHGKLYYIPKQRNVTFQAAQDPFSASATELYCILNYY